MATETTIESIGGKKRSIRPWVLDLLLVYVLLMGAYFRLSGLYWGEYQYLHPDERFLVWVGSDITPLKCLDSSIEINACPPDQQRWMSFSEYFNTAASTLNPNNRGHGFYVYGTLPMFLTRYVVQWVFGHSGFMEMTQVGRALSALIDLFTILLVYLVGERLYDRRVGLLAAAFSAATVLQIQQSHFFTMDTFINFFTLLAFYFAVRVLVNNPAWDVAEDSTVIVQEPLAVNPFSSTTEAGDTPGEAELLKRDQAGAKGAVSGFFHHPLFLPSLGFGIAYGMAVASKINAAPVALVLPAAMILRLVKLPPEERRERAYKAFGYLVMAGFVSVLVFRILQPYAFSGPGFFGLKLNPQWLANLRELRNQNTVEVDFPPAMQWARRPIWFSFQNMVSWGFGLPLGILAWSGFLWAGWRILKGEWQRHTLIWGWTALYFSWQSLALNPTMRYQLPVYPTLEIFAGWAIVALWDQRGKLKQALPSGEGLEPLARPANRRSRLLAILVGAVVLVATYGYAYGFSQIYLRPITRVAASRWIYENIPGPINLHIQAVDGDFSQSLPFSYSGHINSDLPYTAIFQAKASGVLTEVYLPHVKNVRDQHETQSLVLTISDRPGDENSLATATISTDFTPIQDDRGDAYTLALSQPVPVVKDQSYYLQLEVLGQKSSLPVGGQASIRLQMSDGNITDETLPFLNFNLGKNTPIITDFDVTADAELTQVFLPLQAGQAGALQPQPLNVVIHLAGIAEPLVSDTLQAIPVSPDDSRGAGYAVSLNEPFQVFQEERYQILLLLPPSDNGVSLAGATLANEGEWDDGLPLRVDGYDAMGGIYPPDINFNMYWDDNPDKLARFIKILNESDDIVITSSRQWGSLPRLPERFPMTTIYYRNLIGCPAEKTIEWCYNVAQPGMFKSGLGFDLIKVFESDPDVGPVHINDQFSEEAFTVYDHPKVFIFQKSKNYDAQRVQETLSAVDFSQVIRIPPLKAGSYPANLMLPSERLAEEQAGGTWSQLFDTQALQNRFQFLGVVIWYISLFLLGLFTYPLLRIAFPGLSDHGYPLARIAGMLMLSYLVWLAGSFQIPFSRLTISVVIALIAILGGFLAFHQRDELRRELTQKSNYFLVMEALFLAFFALDLLIRFGNPDLWHPYKGGEKPMDFSYFNAVLKSTTFPPYDPWYAGGYLNYYYYGFVFVGVLVKWLGIVPSIAYNLILPTIFSMVAMGAFSLGWNLLSKVNERRGPPRVEIPIDEIPPPGEPPEEVRPALPRLPFIGGISAALGMALLGNLGTVRMIFQGYEKLAAPGGVIEGANLIVRWVWAARGFLLAISGASLPYAIGDWYWNPSRAIPAPGDVEPITEFPFFTVLYGDPHAHLFALPIALLVLGFALAVVLSHARWKSMLGAAAGFLIGGLAIGALRPTNTWDFYPYLALGVVAVGYPLLFYFQPDEKTLKRLPFLVELPEASLRLIAALGGVLVLIALAFLLYQPYAQWYGLGYGKVDLWKGSNTPVSAYLTHWGLSLFIIVSWMVWETRDWLARTPFSSLRKLEPYKGLIQSSILLLVAVLLGLLFLKVQIAWLALPLAAWAGVLILRPGQTDAKRFILFLVGTGMVLTLMVELIVLRGDIGRMNTVFKFYLQVWTLLAISAAAALGWLLLDLPFWLPRWRKPWQVALVALVLGAALYPLMAGLAKVKDRMVEEAPHTLDGMLYMDYAQYNWEGDMDLSQDYAAIRWMQENVQGSPVIVEANLRDLYRWGSRFSIYTGLPGVVGWEWHEQQQRALIPGNWISDRIAEIDDFYQTTDLKLAQDFLRKYDVKYIVVGQLERNHYPSVGLGKFPAANGVLWREVYSQGATTIYEVVPN